MDITIDTGKKRDLTGKQMAGLDARLRAKFVDLVGWTYSPITGELGLDFGDEKESRLVEKLKDRLEFAKDEGKFLNAGIFDRKWTDEDISAAKTQSLTDS